MHPIGNLRKALAQLAKLRSVEWYRTMQHKSKRSSKIKYVIPENFEGEKLESQAGNHLEI
jgi:hypothetical protein